MASVNKVIIVGNLTRDPELRYTPKGTACCEIGLAVNRKYKPEGGAVREEVTFLDVVIWDKRAEVVTKYLKKGAGIYIEGRLQMDSWEDKVTGQKRSKIRIVAEDFQFIDRAPKADSTTPAASTGPVTPTAADDDGPF